MKMKAMIPLGLFAVLVVFLAIGLTPWIVAAAGVAAAVAINRLELE